MSEVTANNAKPVTGQRLLPKSFSPSMSEVIIGRGRKVTNHCGNEQFRDLIYSEIQEYSAAESKTAKSAIIFRVLQKMKNGSPSTGGFVKQESKTKRWFAVEDATARTTCAQAFRDALSSNYRSSKQYKQQRRWNRKSTPTSTTTSPSSLAPATARAPESAERTEVEILPRVPLSMAAFSSLPPLAPRPSPNVAGSQLGDILDSALETVGEVMPLPAAMPSISNQILPSPVPAVRPALVVNEVDLDALWDTLGVQGAVTSNPFEPTPISPVDTDAAPTRRGLASPASTVVEMLRQQQQDLLQEQSETKDHCGVCWKTTIQSQIRDNSFWQEGLNDQVGSGFSLRQALCCRHP